MPTYTTYQTVGNREDMIDKIFNVSPTDTPLTSSIAKVEATGVYHEWQRDQLRAPNPDNAAIEGADATYGQQAPTQRLGNRCQIVSDTFKISGTQNKVRHAGGSELKRLKAKKMIELKKDIEAAAIANATAVVGNDTTPRKMRGLNGWIATNNNMGAGGVAPDPINNTPPTAGTTRPFTEDLFKDAILKAYTSGGNVTMALMNPTRKQKASSFTGNVQRMHEVDNNPKTATLNTAYTFYGSDFGTIKLVPNRVMANGVDGNVYGIDPDYWALATLRGFEDEELAKVGDSRNFEIIWEGTLEAREERSSFAVRDLTDA
ncbi:DUF5309 domain-containing protein [Cupriavidus sp. DB3]|uniref:DUF5309 domain-containing protein n=1 Tax=Cupriavidus sp. DB3 TaxID=2873259 RepID=UPI001CF5F85D|nr:DUF5309 domain-containing protein [Cupriavidus sp. DB3]MCA7085845.1 DUF5309 domain-containing protein [Cupriavidus sp. DB3]